MNIDTRTLFEDDNDEYAWSQSRAAVRPGTGEALITAQKCFMRSDYYSGTHVVWSSDGGQTWALPPEPCPNLEKVTEERGTERFVCDLTPGYHRATGKWLAFGFKSTFTPELKKAVHLPKWCETAYTTFTFGTAEAPPWRILELPEGFFFAGASGCTQWLELDDGRILLPFCFGREQGDKAIVTVLECAFDGETVHFLSSGSEHRNPDERGFGEPSIIGYGGRYFMTIRNDLRGYVTSGDDGLHYAEPIPWTFDDGADLGSYNTQQHWIASKAGLFLVYTRKGANNDHIKRHRAPLFIAQVDPERLCVIRETEQVAIPERGAMLGNNGCTTISDSESWIVESEGMRVKLHLREEARRLGARGATFLVRVTWD